MNEYADLTVQPTELESIPDAIRQAQATAFNTNMMCGKCDRRLCLITRWSPIPKILTTPLTTFEESHHCRWCARPISAAAIAQAPREGFIALAREILGDRIPGRPQSIPTEVA